MVHIPPAQMKSKLDPHSRPGIFMRYPFDSSRFYALIEGDSKPRLYRSGQFYESDIPGIANINDVYRDNYPVSVNHSTLVATLGLGNSSISQPIDRGSDPAYSEYGETEENQSTVLYDGT